MAEPKREVVLLPGQSVFVRTEKGNLKTFTGPYKWDLGTNDALVTWNRGNHKFEELPLEKMQDSFQQAAVVPEGYYAILTNPASKTDKENHPQVGTGNDTVDLKVGEKVNDHGPAMFHLWPGQTVDLIRGHHLSRNEFVRIKVYDPIKAKENWSKAAVATEVVASDNATKKTSFFTAPPADLAMGKQYNVRGDQVSFYMPPTGVSVMLTPDGTYVRQAVTLQLLQYCILEDESGQKRYVRGPDVVFPDPTEEFREDDKGSTAFRALELNAIQRIHLKFSKEVTLSLTNEMGEAIEKKFKAGDEASFTGAELPIYYPEEGHQLVTYDGKLVHYAVQVSDGEGRYVLERMTGKVNTVTGPAMLLPDPTKEVIVLRPLTDKQVMDWFPGPDGTGSSEALAWNRSLRERANAEPTTRQGTVSAARASTMESMDLSSASYGNTMGSVSKNHGSRSGSVKAGFEADLSRQGKSQRLEGDSTERGGTFNAPRTVTLFNKFNGVPLIDLYPGFAISLVRSNGIRETMVGPKKVLLGFGDALDTLQVSMGKPKSTDRLQRVTYLQTQQNRISDIVEVVTKDNVKLFVKLSYILNFQGDSSKWFTISNFVKHLCDRTKSILKSTVRKQTAKVFYETAADFIRDTILGTSKDAEDKRPGMLFPENGMHVVDVDVLAVEMTDMRIKELFEQVQRETVINAIDVERSDAALMVFKKKEENVRMTELEKSVTEEFRNAQAIEEQENYRRLLAEQGSTAEKQREVEAAAFTAMLAAEKKKVDQAMTFDTAKQNLHIALLKEETAATVAKFEKVAPGFTEALLALKDADTLVKVSQALSAQMLFGGNDVAQVFSRAVAGTPLESVFKKVLASASAQQAKGTNGTAGTTPQA